MIFSLQSSILQNTKKVLEKAALMLFKILPGFSPQIEKSDIREILIPQLHGIGDAIIFAPILHEIKELFSKARITILTHGRTHELMTYLFPGSRILRHEGLFKLWGKRGQFDLIINPFRKLNHYLIDLILKPDYLVGFNITLSVQSRENHYRRGLRLLNQLGGQAGLEPDYSFIRDYSPGRSLIENIVEPEDTIICLIVGGRWASKTYPIDNSRKLINRLLEFEKTAVVLLGSDRRQCDELIEGKENVFSLCGETDLLQAIECIRRCDLLVGPDGGLLHMAVMFGKPFIGLFSSVEPGTVIPADYLKRIVTSAVCEYQPCYNEEHEPFCPMEKPICMDIEPEEVVDRIKECYPGILKKK